MRPFLIALLCLSCGCSDGQSPTPLPAPGPTGGCFESARDSATRSIFRPAPARFRPVVIGHGSGQQTKASGAFLVRFWHDLGFAVLRYDKRGVGQSTGTYRGVSAATA
jgi:hypothetical protein